MAILPIKGIEKLSLIDYAPYSAAVVFISGCNFRCPYCHNSELVLEPDKQDTIPVDEVLDFIMMRKRWLDAVVITGGEPTLYPELEDFARKIKEQGFRVKLDTNGTNPVLLEKLLSAKLLDFVSMDIKAPFARYQDITIHPADTGKIKRSVAILKSSGISHEFRITVLPKLISAADIEQIGKDVGGKKFAIQQFRPKGVLDKSYESEKLYSHDELRQLAKVAQRYFEEVEIRGI